jgi:hypothetical protein
MIHNGPAVTLGYKSGLFDGSGTVPYYQVMKFAELIIRECAATGSEAVANGDLVEDSILEHFGVTNDN